jgi:type I restriction-modification system DNA methylase subunit/restriction endonuclease S subunit
METKPVEVNDKRSMLKNMLKQFLDILRDSEGLTGEKALRNISYLLTLKLIEPRIGQEIKMDEYDFDFSHILDDMVVEYRAKLMRYIRFSSLSKEDKGNLSEILKCLWNDILSRHTATRGIFLPGKGFDIRSESTFKKLVDKLNAINFAEIECDVLGSAYEDTIKDVMTGKVLGQFFTPVDVKNMMIEMIAPVLRDDGTIETCCDPTMGCGGFLISYLRNILKQASERNVALDWNQIKTTGLYGKELEPDTYQLCVSNMLISSGHMFEELERGDSIREPIARKFDNILANPPFGIKGLKYDEFNSVMKARYTPIKSNSAVSLFLQAIICILNVGGKCAVVVPDGQDLFGKTKAHMLVREYLMRTCDLKEVIYLPSKIFDYTSIKTCVFHFVKKIEGECVLVVKEKKTTKSYEFVGPHQTTNIDFYECDPRTDVPKKLIISVLIDDVAKNSYSLNCADYVKRTEQPKQYIDGVVEKTIGELFSFTAGKLQATKCSETGEYHVVSSGGSHTHESNTLDGKNLFISRVLDPSSLGWYKAKVKYFDGKCDFTSLLYHMKPNDENIICPKFMYYLLGGDIENISKEYQKGSCNKSLNLDLFNNHRIPLPSLEQQTRAVEYLDFIYDEAIKTSEIKIAQLKKISASCIEHQERYGENERKTLGEIIKKSETGRDISTPNRIFGQYPFYGANGIIDTVDHYLFDGVYLLTARTGSLGSLHISNGKFNCSGDVHKIEFDNTTTLYYIYYYLHIIDFQKYRTGAAHPKLSTTSLKSIPISVPSLEQQAEIVEYCDRNEALIKELEQDIERNKQLAKKYMANITRVA